MYISTEQVKKILRNCNIEFGGVHQVTGWDHYIAVYRLDDRKLTFKVNSKNPRKSTLDTRLILELQKRIGEISLSINESFSGFNTEVYTVDPNGVLFLVNKYLIGQYTNLDKKVG